MSAVVVATGCLAAAMTLIHAQEQRTARDRAPEAAMIELWSDDEAARLAAKERLIELGSQATKPLMALLQDIANNPGPRYVRGKEKEGAEAWERYGNLANEQERAEASRRLMGLEISARLNNDVYELLGRLQAEEAVPLLVESMEKQEIDNMIPRMTPVMRALVEIGPAAVPRLIESIERSVSTAASSPDVTAPDLSDEAKQRNLEWQTTRIRVNAVLVLESIGDGRAIPALDKLLNTTRNEFLARTIGDAIRAIKDKEK